MLSCVLSAKGCPETFSVLVSTFSDLRNPCEAFSKPRLFVMVRDMRPNNFQKTSQFSGGCRKHVIQNHYRALSLVSISIKEALNPKGKHMT